MTPFQIEAWALRVIDQVKQKQPNEDHRVELKSEWPTDEKKAARILGGHANSARGEPILWLIGLDEKLGVKGAEEKNLANWYPAISKEFDGLAPSIIPVNVPIDGKTIVALLFETTRSPFVVKNAVFGSPGGGQVSLEVPWRESTKTRSATREDLIRLLAPLQYVPTVQVLGGEVILMSADAPQFTQRKQEHKYVIKVDFYIAPKSTDLLTIPYHQCQAVFDLPGIETRDIILGSFNLTPPQGSSGPMGMAKHSLSMTINNTTTELLIIGPGLLLFRHEIEVMPREIDRSLLEDIQISGSFLPIDMERAIPFKIALPSVSTGSETEFAKWQMGKLTFYP